MKGEEMKINKEQLERLASLPDDKLWEEIVNMGKKYGIKMPSATPAHSELEKLRATVRGSRLNVAEAMRILGSYRKGG